MNFANVRSEHGIVIGNTFNKYESRNPIVRSLVSGFTQSLDAYLMRSKPSTIHEVGCGEGHWVAHWRSQGYKAFGTDFSQQIIETARTRAAQAGVDATCFEQASIYDLTPEAHSADLIVCCEVLEHLSAPRTALQRLQNLDCEHVIFSVPNEPLWRFLNLCRARYVGSLGNTPGHLQHWSSRAFQRLVSQHFKIIDACAPTPWTMLLCQPFRG